MTRYILRRGLGSLVTLFFFLTAVFFLVQIIVPADFTVQFALGMGPAHREALREELGLNLPLWQQYLNWMGDFVTGKLGTSFYGNDVIEVLKQTIPLSMLLFIPGITLAYILGLRLGTQRTIFGNPASSFNRQLWSEIDLEPAAAASRMLLTFAVLVGGMALLNWQLVRRGGRGRPVILGIIFVGGLSFLIWQAWGFGPQAIDLVSIASIPLLTFILLTFGETMLIMRTSLREQHNQEYVTVARAKGLPESTVRDKHASRNAILPVVSRLIISLPFLLTGIVIIEDVLGWPGVGSTLFGSLYQQDMPMVMALFLLVGLVTLVARLILEVVLAMMDPRLRITGTQETKV